MDTNLFDRIPIEIQEIIASYLTQHDLYFCVLVSQSWNTLFTPSLWCHIDNDLIETDQEESFYYDDDDSWTWSDQHLACAKSGAFQRNGHLIQSIRLDKAANSSMFLEHCPSVFPHLTTVVVKSRYGCYNEGLAKFLDRCCCGSGNDGGGGGSGSGGGLKTLLYGRRTIASCQRGFEDILVDALVKHARTLEVIRLGSSIVCGGENIDRLLRSCPNLKELGMMGHHKAVHGGGLDARAIKDSEWVCKNLEVFECPIRNIPRLDITREVDILKHTKAPIKEGTLQESIDLQHQTYAKLAQFTKLRELTLSLPLTRQGTPMYQNSLRRGFRQYDCLAMTLKSGLGLLKGLKDLKVVRLEGMEVYVDGDEEQSWVKEQWPKATISWTYYDDDCYDSSSSSSSSEGEDSEDRLDESYTPISIRCRRM